MSEAIPLLHDYLLDTAARVPDKIALVCDKRRWTYAQIDACSNALAHALVERGVRRGDRVVVFSENRPEAAIAFWAVLKANAVVLPLHPQTKADKLAYILNDSRAVAIVTHESLSATVRAVAPRCAHLQAVVAAGLDDVAFYVENGSSPPVRRCIDVDLAAIIYTSGSTGEPKGVMLTHRNMIAAASSISTYLGTAPDDVILGVLPLSFDYGLYQVIMSAKAGARLVLEKGFAYVARILAAIVEEGVTALPGVPMMFAMMSDLRTIGDYDLSRVRYVTNTAAALPPKHILRLRSIFPNARIFSMYGLTECKRCTYLPPEDLERKPTSVGVAIPNTEMWLVDEQGHRVAPNVVGELVIRGATVMAGYWEKPEETAMKLRPGPLPGERVLHTGDYCRMDDEGYLYFVGRMDDIIKSRGEKVAPKEIEAVLYSVAGVKEAVVVGVADELLGQAPKAFVVLEEGAKVDVAQLRRECQARLEGFMVPKFIELATSLPKSGNGKIDKSALA